MIRAGVVPVLRSSGYSLLTQRLMLRLAMLGIRWRCGLKLILTAAWRLHQINFSIPTPGLVLTTAPI